MLTAVHRYYDLMCQSRSLSPTSLLHSLVSLCSLDHLLLVFSTFPTLALRIFPRMLGPLPRLSQQCICPFLPTELRSSPTVERVDTFAITRATTSARNRISGLQSFLNVQASRFACHPGRSYRCSECPQGSRGVYFRAPYELLPPHTSDMLAV